MREPGCQNVGAIIARDVAAPVDVAQLTPRLLHPPAMVPRASDEIIEMIRIGLFQRRVNAGWAHEVFLIVPASDVQIRHGSVLQIGGYGMLLPEVMVWMLDEVVPGGQISVEVTLIRIR